jgi:hypothetical protein
MSHSGFVPDQYSKRVIETTGEATLIRRIIYDCTPAMINYFDWIDSYLHGTLKPEEEVLFERQLDRNRELAEEVSRHFSTQSSAGQVRDAEQPAAGQVVRVLPDK